MNYSNIALKLIAHIRFYMMSASGGNLGEKE